uniref:4-nitrophenylphosphatase n=2 Tax=Dendroctonus ponderosae TaxID=77166 RepID=A0AAR5P7J8_DENPD
MAKLRSLNDLSETEAQREIASTDAVLFDVDGVLLSDKAVLPGAEATVQKLRALGKQIGFVTNNTLYTLEKIQANLAQFSAQFDEVINPTAALLEYLRKIDFQKDIYMISTSEPKRLVRAAGYNVLEFKDILPEKIEPTLGAVYEAQELSLQRCKNVGLVYLDYDMNCGYGDIQCALNIIKRIDGVQVLSGLNDDEVPGPNGALIGSQFYIDGIERLTQTKAIKMGKPGGVLGELIVSKFNLPTGSRVLMVGDNIHSDIQFGINSGFKTLLVLSGVTKQEQVDQWDAAEELKPDFVGRSIADLHEKIRNM